LVLQLFVMPRARRFDTRFDSARRGEITSIRLAADQPAPDGPEVTLPMTVQLRPRWPYFGVVGVLTSLLVGSGLAALVMASGLFAAANGVLSWQDLGGPAAVVESALAAFSLAFTFTSGRETLTVSEDGVSLHKRRGLNPSIKWSDMRLFAIASNSGRQDPKVIVFTIAGPDGFVMWPYVKRMAWDIYLRPTIPCEQYERQMEALLSLIAVRTGLPLYDLR
jgi:hypothetical protein